MSVDLEEVIAKLEVGPAVTGWTLYADNRTGNVVIPKLDLIRWLKDAKKLKSTEELFAKLLDSYCALSARLNEADRPRHGGVHSPEFTAAFESTQGKIL